MTDWLDEVPWNEAGLIAAVAQDAASGRVLTVAWMNRDALRETAARGEAVYWSRSRGKLWRKGEESGHVQRLRELRLDCDADAVLAASIFHFGEFTVRQAKAHLRSRGIEVRE